MIDTSLIQSEVVNTTCWRYSCTFSQCMYCLGNSASWSAFESTNGSDTIMRFRRAALQSPLRLIEADSQNGTKRLAMSPPPFWLLLLLLLLVPPPPPPPPPPPLLLTREYAIIIIINSKSQKSAVAAYKISFNVFSGRATARLS